MHIVFLKNCFFVYFCILGTSPQKRATHALNFILITSESFAFFLYSFLWPMLFFFLLTLSFLTLSLFLSTSTLHGPLGKKAYCILLLLLSSHHQQAFLSVWEASKENCPECLTACVAHSGPHLPPHTTG